MSTPSLDWQEVAPNFAEALLGTPADGVWFSLDHYPTCYRRGPWRLLIHVLPGEHHHAWGCFDEADQPMRYYHLRGNAISEANRIAAVLWRDRYKEIANVR